MANRTLEELLEESRGEEPTHSPFDQSKHLTWHHEMLQVADLRQTIRTRTRADDISDQINSTIFRR